MRSYQFGIVDGSREISLFELKEIEPIRSGWSYFTIGRQLILAPGYENTMLHYGDFSATNHTVSSDNQYSVQIAGSTKFAIAGSLFRICWLPANRGYRVCGCILHVYWLATDIGDEDSQSREDLVSTSCRTTYTIET